LLRRLFQGPRRGAAVAMICAVSALAAASAGNAGLGNELGALLVQQPCCSGAALQGSRSYIQLPSSPSVGTKRQVLSQVGAEDTGTGTTQVDQIGITMDNNLVIDADPTCFTPYNTLVGFYEWWDYSLNGGVRCKALGQVTTGHLYSTAEQSNTKWQLFVDGNPQLSSPLIEMHGTYAPNAGRVKAGGEVAWDTSQSGPEPVNWQAIYGGSGNTPWQRFNNTLGWTTINANNAVCNGPPNICTGGSWTFSTGSFPTTWSVSH